MKKLALLFVVLFYGISFAVEPVKPAKSDVLIEMIKITIVDDNTNEILAGVNVNGDVYTNFDGNIYVRKGEKLKVNFISYEDCDTTLIESDTLRLKPTK